jgi:hypothetical protein
MLTVPDFYNLIAHERGLPAEWRWYSLRVLPERQHGKPTPRDQAYVLVHGAVCTAVFRTGPRKGQTNWLKLDKATQAEFVIPMVELDARIERWEREAGSCRECGGTGQSVRSIGIDGTSYRPCMRCDANQLQMFK